MHAIAAPASIREQALGVIGRRFDGPVSLGKKLIEAGDAMLVADVLSDLEVKFGIYLDDFWKPATLDELALLVEQRVEEKLARDDDVFDRLPVALEIVDLAAVRARRARAPLFPPPTARAARIAAHRERRAHNRRQVLEVYARLGLVAAMAGGVGALAVGVLALFGIGL
jgi:hypothetical protein